MRLACLRRILAELKNKEIEIQAELFQDEQVIAILRGIAKKHQDSIAQFRKGARPDLVSQEEAELAVVQTYLPPELSDADLQTYVTEALVEAEATSQKDFGKVMKLLMSKLAGRADGARVANLLKAKLN